MENKQNSQKSGIYTIRIRGTIDERHLRWFEEVQMSSLPHGETLIKGRMADQSALFGILNRLRDLNLKLLELRIEDEEQME